MTLSDSVIKSNGRSFRHTHGPATGTGIFTAIAGSHAGFGARRFAARSVRSGKCERA
jgi:hypothetical protein